MRRHGLLIILIGACLAACSLLVDGEPAELGCSAEGEAGPPACDEGFICAANRCVIRETAQNDGATAGDGGTGGDGATAGDGGNPRGGLMSAGTFGDFSAGGRR